MHRSGLPFSLMMSVLAACASDTPSDRDDFGYEGTGIQFNVAPLTLGSLTDACYSFAVVNGSDELVVGRGPEAAAAHLDGDGQSLLSGNAALPLCASRFGNSDGGDISYVAPCDAQESPEGNALHTVTLWVDRLCTTGTGSDCAQELQGWVDPCVNGCNLDVACVENADVPVTFNLTIMSPARQGFFDLAVNFDAVFCSAKLDTCYGDVPVYPGDAITLLFDEDGQRQHTAVAAVACTAGPGNDDDTTLYHTLFVVECGDPLAPTRYSLDLTQVGSDEGNLATDVAGPALGTYDLGVDSDGQVYRWILGNDEAERIYTAPAQFQALTAAVYVGTTQQSTLTPSGVQDANVVYTNVAFLVPQDVPEGCTVRWAVVPTDGPPPAPPSNSAGLYQNVASVDFGAKIQVDACHQHPVANAYVRLDGAVVAKDFGTRRKSTVELTDDPSLTDEENKERREEIARQDLAIQSTLFSGYGIGSPAIVAVDLVEEQRERSSRIRAITTVAELDDRVSALDTMEYVAALGPIFVAKTDENGKITAVPAGLKELADPKSGVFAIADVATAGKTGALNNLLPKRNGSDRVHIFLDSGLPRTFHGFMFGGDSESAMRDVDTLVFHGVRDQEELYKRFIGVSVASDITPLGKFFSTRLLSLRIEVDRGAPIMLTDVVPMTYLEDSARLSEGTLKAVAVAKAGEWVRLPSAEANMLLQSIPPGSFAVAQPALIPREGTIDGIKDRSYTTVAFGPIYWRSGDFSTTSFAAGPEAFAKGTRGFSLADQRVFSQSLALSPAPSPSKPSGQATMALPLKRPDLDAEWAKPQYVEVHGFGHHAAVAPDDADKVQLSDFANLRDVVTTFNDVEVQIAHNASALSKAIPGANTFSFRMRVGQFTLDFVDVVVEQVGGKLTTSADTRLDDSKKEAQPISADLTAVPDVDAPLLGFTDIKVMLSELGVEIGKGGFGAPYRIEFGDNSELARFVEGFFSFGGCDGQQCAFLSVCAPEASTCICDRGLMERDGDCVDPSELNPRQTFANGSCQLSGEFRSDLDAMWPRGTLALPFGVARLVSPEKMLGFGLELETHEGAHRMIGGVEFNGFKQAEGAEFVSDPELAVMHFVVRGYANNPSSVRVLSDAGELLSEQDFTEQRAHVLQIAVSLVDIERDQVATWSAVGDALEAESFDNFATVARIVDLAGSIDGEQDALEFDRGGSVDAWTVVRNGQLCTTIRCNGQCRLGAIPWDGGGDVSSRPDALAVVCADNNGNRNLQALLTASSEDGNHGIDAVMLGASANGLILVANAGGTDLRLNPHLGTENTRRLAATEGSPWVFDLANPLVPHVFRIGRQGPGSAKEAGDVQEAWVEAYSAAIVDDSVVVVGSSSDSVMSEVPFVVRIDRRVDHLTQAWSVYGESAGANGYATFQRVASLGAGRIGISGNFYGVYAIAGLTVGDGGSAEAKSVAVAAIAGSYPMQATWWGHEAHVVTLDMSNGQGVGAVRTGLQVVRLVGDGSGGAYVAFDASGGRFGDNRLGGGTGGYETLYYASNDTSRFPSIGRVDGSAAAWMVNPDVGDATKLGNIAHFGGLLADRDAVRVDFAWRAADDGGFAQAYPAPDGNWGDFRVKDPVKKSLLPTFGTGIPAPTPRSFTGHVTLGIAGPCGCDDGEGATAAEATVAVQTSYTMCGNASWDAETGEWSCKSNGFDFVAGSGSVCADVDECAAADSACAGPNTMCFNEIGSFRCECRPGYQAGSGADCVDINECTDTALNACGAGASCVNETGGYGCRCEGDACECPEGAWPLDASGAKCDTIVDIATSGGHACALSRTGLVACWGTNEKIDGVIGAPMPDFEEENMWTNKQSDTRNAETASKDDVMETWPWLRVATPYHIQLPEAASAIATGDGASCAVVGPANQTWCWGAGINANEQYWKPAPVSGWTNVKAIAVGSSRVCAILDSGVLDCRSSGPIASTSGSDATPVVSGCDALHTKGESYFARCNGDWVAWGHNGSGQLGIGANSQSGCSLGLCVIGMDSSYVSQPKVVSGDWDTIRTNGDLTCGLGVATHNGDAEPQKGIHCWGGVSHNGQGNWTNSNYWTAGKGPFMAAPAGRAWTEIDVSWGAVCATDSAGAVKCAGVADWLPRVANVEPWTARPIPELDGVVATRMALNDDMLWLIASGSLQVLSKKGGERTRTLGAQGGPAEGATLLDATRPWVEVVTGWGGHVCGIDAEARLWCRGDNGSGQLGQGYPGSWVGQLLEVEPPEGVDGWLEVSLGNAHTCAIAANKKLYCWGNNGSGQLGDSNGNWHYSPFDVFGTSNAMGAFANAEAHSVSVGVYHSCAVIDIDGAAGALNAEVFCWGSGGNGGLGLGDNSSRNFPARVNHSGAGAPPGAYFARVTAGGYHTIFVDDEGAAWSAGDNWYGQLGAGHQGASQKPDLQTDFGPFPVAGGSDVIAVATGWNTTCLQKAGGRIECAGENYGSLGDAWWGSNAWPATIDLPFDVSAMVMHSNGLACLLSVDGEVACSGSFGDNQRFQGFEVVKAFAGRSWSGLVVRDNTVMAISDGAVFGAGSDPFGLFGTERGFVGPARFACHVDNFGESQCYDPPGLTCNAETRLCNDYDECAKGEDDCSEVGKACANVSSGFACFCANGTDGDDGCEDVNWKTVGVCGGADDTVVDQDTSAFHCTCKNSYTTYRAGAQACDDANECLQDNGICGSDAHCENRVMSEDDAPEGYLCHCESRGYRWDDTEGCTDIDECAEETSGCDDSATCTNTPGGWTCECPEGLSDVKGNGTWCEDIDECKAGTSDCDDSATCTNTTGGWTCECPEGSTDVYGDGSSCTYE